MLHLEPTSTATGHASSSSRTVTTPRGRDTMTVTSSRHEGPSARRQEPPRLEATASQTQRSHPRGLAIPLRMSGRQGSTRSHLRGRSVPAATIPSSEEMPSLAHGPEIATTSPWTSARGLAALQATMVRSVTASNTSVSDISFDSSRSAQAHPQTHLGSPISTRELEPEPTHRANQIAGCPYISP
jgi:hypothetical protein